MTNISKDVKTTKDKPVVKKKKKTIKVSKNLQTIINQVEKLTVLELSELVKALEDKFGVSAAAPVAAVAAGTPAEAVEEKEEKSEYQVVLTDTGANKIGVIKALREINQDLGLKEAKDLTEANPKEVGTFKTKEAEEAKKKLESAGAQVELK
ncbi:MAG: 50S ribosomal protein L7/L12 [Patescibacteria group bacterium]|nr:50S ribosomal protein L7/L12 [Patescibacteria group bacterium]